MKKIIFTSIAVLMATSISNAQNAEPEIKLPTSRSQIQTEGSQPKPAEAKPITQEQKVEIYVDPEIERESRRTKKEVMLNSLNKTRLNSQLEVKKIEQEINKIDGVGTNAINKQNAAQQNGNSTGDTRSGLPVITIERLNGSDNIMKAVLNVEGYGQVVLKEGQSVPLTELNVKTIDMNGVTLKDKNDLIYTVPFSS